MKLKGIQVIMGTKKNINTMKLRMKTPLMITAMGPSLEPSNNRENGDLFQPEPN